MRRLLVSLALCTCASFAAAERYALIVGVDKYAFIMTPTQQLRGAQTDVSLMKRLLDLYGFKSTVLLREEATRRAIVEGLANLSKSAKRGDEVLFYFSGRGALAPNYDTPGSKVGWEPTLVPADGSSNSLDPDIRMRRLEEWSIELHVKGVQTTIILDASFQNPTRTDFGRQYHPVARSIQRSSSADAEVREWIFRGPAVFLSSAPARGAAYEWLQNSAEGRWSGAFTDQLVNVSVSALSRGENPSYVDVMREVQAYFKDKVRADYMPGLDPQPAMEAMIGKSPYEREAFGGVNVDALPPNSKAAIAAMEKARVEREKRLRIGVEVRGVPNEKDRAKFEAQVRKDLSAHLQGKLPFAEFAPDGAPPDVIVQVNADKKAVTTTVKGDDLDKTRQFTFTGKDFKKTLDSGLAEYLELRALVIRLHRITASEKPGWQGGLTARAEPLGLARGETFNLEINVTEEVLVYVLNRDDADGVLQLAFPQNRAPFSQHVATLLKMGGTIENDTSDGRMMLRVLAVPAKGEVRIPDVDMSDEKKFRESLIRQLRVVVDAMEKKRLPWAAQTINLRIR